MYVYTHLYGCIISTCQNKNNEWSTEVININIPISSYAYTNYDTYTESLSPFQLLPYPEFSALPQLTITFLYGSCACMPCMIPLKILHCFDTRCRLSIASTKWYPAWYQLRNEECTCLPYGNESTLWWTTSLVRRYY